jgi:hypothetical protein
MQTHVSLTTSNAVLQVFKYMASEGVGGKRGRKENEEPEKLHVDIWECV